MEINNINSAQSFKSLNIKKVEHAHRRFVRANLGDLKRLGEQYDIIMKSSIGDEILENGISIIVKPLRKNLSFLKKFNRPKGMSFFYTDCRNSEARKNTTVLGQTKEAISDLRKNSLLAAISSIY